MNMNNFLMNDQNKWMTPELLKQISENPILVKLFSNPEYLNVKYIKIPSINDIFSYFYRL